MGSPTMITLEKSVSANVVTCESTEGGGEAAAKPSINPVLTQFLPSLFPMFLGTKVAPMDGTRRGAPFQNRPLASVPAAPTSLPSMM